MPSRRVHDYDADTNGYSREVNRMIDFPVKWMGPSHRDLFHTPEEAMLIGYFVDGWDGAIGGLRHIALDELGSSDKVIKGFLELLARMKPRSRGIKLKWSRPEEAKIYQGIPVYETKVRGLVVSHEEIFRREITQSIKTLLFLVIALWLME